MKFRKGDIFIHKNKGTIAIITRIGVDTYDFKYSHPDDKPDGKPPWQEIKNKPITNIATALNEGYVELYRPHSSFLEDELFEVS